MSRIEKGLHEHHARLAEQANNPAAASQAQAALSPPPAALEAPFAKVNSVVEGSPADTAGLRIGDTITKFGWVDWTNHQSLSRVAEAVSQNEGVRRITHAAVLARLETSGGPGCTTCRPEARVQHANTSQIPITVKALRPSPSGDPAETVQMQLTPRRNWGGRGLLGCHLLPL
jgi:26S proteasome non-ATPase regulatory subunit 9